MAIEIERKFLVRDDGWRARATRALRMRQGYLTRAERCSIRVRVTGDEARLNIKSAVIGRERQEFDWPIAPADAAVILADLCLGPPIEKVRHVVPHAGHIWEVDEFEGANAGLVVAEIELKRSDEVFEAPPWLGREVTDERRYYNQALVEHPYRSWPK